MASAKVRIICEMPAGQREALGVRSRGASKTWDEMMFDLWLAQLRDPYLLLPEIRAQLPWEAPVRGYWFSTSEDQLDQPKEYFDYIIDHSFLRFIIKKKTNTLVRFKHGGKLKLSILTKKKVRSGRGDYVTVDEEAQAEEDLYQAAVGIISGSLFGFLSHISTPAKATIFEKNHDKLRKREYTTELKLVFIVPWWDMAFLARNKAFYEEEKRTLPRWLYLQEYCGVFTLPFGAVFQNVDYTPYTDRELGLINDRQLCSGIDWNPVAGHWLAGVKWAPDMKSVFITEEHDLGNGYTHEMTYKQYCIIRIYYMRGNTLVVEEGGINEAYVRWLKEQEADNLFPGERLLHYEEWDNQGIAKLQAVTFLIQNGICIRCDERRFPVLKKMIEDCRWDKKAPEPKLAKDPANSPHALDAFLHAISILNRQDNVIEVGRWY
jgi:hypothetical protein